MIVVINGVSGSGKDEFIKTVTNLGIVTVINRSTIDPIKEAMIQLGWNGDRTPEDRQMMVDIKKLWIKRDQFACTNYVEKIYNEYKELYDKVIIFVHCREPEEIRKIVRRIPDAKTLLVEGRGIAYNNGADNMVRDYIYDYYVDNSGDLYDLAYEAAKLVKLLLNKSC